MSELGQQLREARLQKGMSLDDVQEMTKIRKRYLEAIEAGDYKVLPGSFYVRAFIKTYAEAVGLNPDELLEGHKQDVPKPQPESTMEPVIQKRSARTSSERNFSWLPTALMWTFPILIIVVIYIYASNANNSAPDKITPPTTQNEPAEPANKGGEESTPNPGGAQGDGGADQGDGEGTETDPGTDTDEGVTDTEEDPAKEQEGQVTVTEDRKQGKSTVFKVASPEGTPVKVEIEASGESWVEIYRGYNSQGEKLLYQMVNAGDSFSFEMDSQGMYVKSAYSPATVITVGGQVVTDGKSTSRLLLEPADSTTTDSDSTETDEE
ncbi:helix-turn-helix domain-containing protein [Paenibacillus faecalis]|uniref:helix-turn-helix domain-containing protein n=1 Tax=Paenibacillus faecalis TaxID=2079532 RepID=UPI000D10AF10|nr:RodZ domain-containing protein [Paenibacillus faecalis]